MTVRFGPATLVLPALALLVCAGCVGVVSLEADPSAPAAREPATAEVVAGEPDIVDPVQRSLPGLIQSIHANGVVLLGWNVANAQSGAFSDYDGGEGSMVGVAFGNGEDIERFVEFIFVETQHHEHLDGDVVTGDMRQTSFYVGGRRYLLPVTGSRSRVAPYFAGGLVWNNIIDKIPPPAGDETPNLRSAYGLGVYVGTGVEFYLGAQLALCMDVRASYWNWEGVPTDTGYQSTGGGSVSLVYHF